MLQKSVDQVDAVKMMMVKNIDEASVQKEISDAVDSYYKKEKENIFEEAMTELDLDDEEYGNVKKVMKNMMKLGKIEKHIEKF